MTTYVIPERLRGWTFELVVVVVFLLTSAYEIAYGVAAADQPTLLLVVCLAGGALLCRRRPSVALLLVWVAFLVQVYAGLPLMLAEVVVAVVAFGCARWGSALTVVLSLLSGPLAGVVAVLFVRSGLGADRFGAAGVVDVLYALRGQFRGAPLLYRTDYVLPLLATAVPWLAGLAVRFLDRARSSQATAEVAETRASEAVLEREQAEEIARLREGQAQLARDVHDVVGHSLAVILAQAESAQYLDDDPDQLKRTLATIAGSARDSLGDVRQVLTDTRGPGDADLDALVAGARRGGREIVDSEVGTPRPLPPELAAVAYRVLQEMLTNAIRHGDRAAPVTVERHWEGELRIEATNAVSPRSSGAGVGESDDETRPLRPDEVAPPGSGQGLVGMRRRLEAVGGRLDVRRRETSFTCTAWIPVRGGGAS